MKKLKDIKGIEESRGFKILVSLGTIEAVAVMITLFLTGAGIALYARK